MEDLFYRELTLIVPEDQVRRGEPMEHHTSLHIGGKADYFVTPTRTEEVRAVLALCREKQIPCYIMGNGSNLLVSDTGFRGVILQLGENFSEVRVGERGIITAQAGVLLARLANIAAEHSLTGFEFASGIPGTLGGAVTMNAGAYDGEMKQCLIAARMLDTEGCLREFTLEELELGYRTSILQKVDYTLLEADIKLSEGDPQLIRQKMNTLNAQRREKQPLDQFSAGSTFKRPPDNYAGKLIGEAGLAGYQVGGAAVSEKHCGFVINKDHASAEDFLCVIRDVIRIVEEKSGVRLEPEVKFLGDFPQK
ncbi:UDP-N-acetylmuramate dehydrogenase [Anaerotaenia torta]|uniref:UDP-N-acetylmuramate dehydrogenase n=1 Tax=Anaerotaenia torta TaxID=433293 RepID=UPI003D1D286F